MPQSKNFNISDEDIEFAESILLKGRGSFDKERIDFIRDFQTRDLQAVPGSGKTTALMAKLLILEKRLPFFDNSGILVLSHTNRAINEIKQKIEKHCPKLFSYPNFVGTIQVFIDTFLAIPFYENIYKHKVHRIDDDIYISKHPSYLCDIRWLKNQHLFDLYDIFLKESDKSLCFVDCSALNLNKDSKTYKLILITKKELREKGILSFNDSFVLAKEYIDNYPIIIDFLQKRFRLVFIDEMQDIDKHQYDLLEKIFYYSTNDVIFQRIGDKNQAIFSDNRKQEESDVWQLRDALKLQGTHRLTKSISVIVNNLSIDQDYKIVSLSNATEVKPQLIIFDDNTINDILPMFASLTRKCIDKNKLVYIPYPIKCIGWRKASNNNKNSLSLDKYFTSYESRIAKERPVYNNLISYIYLWNTISTSKNSIRGIYNSILESIIHILRLENVYYIYNEKQKYYTITSLNRLIRDEFPLLYRNFRKYILTTCIAIQQNEFDKAYKLTKLLAKKILLKIFSKEVSNAKTFMDNMLIKIPEDINNVENGINLYHDDESNIDIQISTVHLVKGETHFATLYVETSYNGKHESEYLKSRLCGTITNDFKYTPMAAKVAYVAMSRPTNLLCFAIHRERYDKIKLIGWDKPIELDKESQKE